MHLSYIIAGPCAAETQQQVLDTAEGIVRCKSLYPNYTYIFRAGIWKPRTSPNTFQGIGDEGLRWLQLVKQQYGLAVATEVSTAQQVNAALDAQIDYLWIGARTAANPIIVQTIAETIQMYKASHGQCLVKGILIKNPVHEDAKLWQGDIERLEHLDLPVIAVHRGCNHHPCWSMAYQLRSQRPDIPLIIDPSHLSGHASAVAQVCYKAQQLGYQGWMIETHINPEEALSDAQQQITPEQLENLVKVLQSNQDGLCTVTELDWLRCMIDEVDDDLWEMIAKRMEICRQIGTWKKEKNIPIVQLQRYQEIVNRRIAWGQARELDANTVLQILEAIHKESVRIQS